MASALTKPPRYYNDSVFINCPFDEDYKPLLRAIVFAIYDSGFIPRCALEEIDSGQNRLERILLIISECKYGIHDISRTELGHTNLPRFNMPFECGLYWGASTFRLKLAYQEEAARARQRGQPLPKFVERHRRPGHQGA